MTTRSRSRRRTFTALLVAGASALGAGGCADAPGEMILVFQTDMDATRDIDAIRIEIEVEGVPKYKSHFDRIGQGALTLPATLGIVAPEEDPTDPVTIRVSGWRSDEARVVREVITPVPPGKVTALHLPLQFLCDGSATTDVKDGEKIAASACPSGETCVAGACESAALPEGEELPEYVEGDVFGGGTVAGDGVCFDVAVCFDAAVVALVDAATCTIELPPDREFNVGLATESAGMCNNVGCFVALDADSELGWQRTEGGRARIPAAACADMPPFGDVSEVVLAPVSAGCPRKSVAIPTCGPWSRVGDSQTRSQPTAVVGGQVRPASVVVTSADVYWVNAGRFDVAGMQGKSSVKRLASASGAVTPLYEGDLAPRQLVADAERVYFTLASEDGAQGAITAVGIGDAMGWTLTADGVAPEGIAANGQYVFWTEFATGDIRYVQRSDGLGGDVIANIDDDPTTPAHPYRVAADDDTVCWTNEGTSTGATGSVLCAHLEGGTWVPQQIAIQERTPRALVLAPDAVYWASFVADGMGAIRRVPRAGAQFGPKEDFATGQDLPGGLAADADWIYWTTRGDGKVWRQPKDKSAAPEELAQEQDRPGDVTVSAGALFWVNEGDPETSIGAIVRLGL